MFYSFNMQTWASLIILKFFIYLMIFDIVNAVVSLTSMSDCCQQEDIALTLHANLVFSLA